MVSEYREFLPDPSLASWIECFWMHGVRPAPVRVLPDTCVDLIFSATRGLEVVGTMTQALQVDAAENAFIGVRFRAARIRGFLNMPLTELTNRSVCGEHIWGTSDVLWHARDRHQGTRRPEETK